MSGQIFISYRGDDSSAFAGRLYDRLAARFARKQILMDISGIACGEDFRKRVEETIGQCDVLIVVIGPKWLTSTDAQGVRRIDSSEDFVHVEIATALRRDVRVIPVLVDGALMPQVTDLPDDLKALVHQNPLRVNASSREGDCSLLISAVVRVLYENTPQKRIVGGTDWLRNFLKSAAALIPKIHESGSPSMNDWLGVEQGVPDNLLTVLTSGQFPKTAQNRTVNKGKSERSPVDCTVFAPDRVERKRSGLLQVFLHAPDERQQAEAEAEKFDPETKERGHKSLVLDAPVGATFAFVVDIEGFEFRERTDTLLWTGQPQAATFVFEVPKNCKWGQHTGTVRISKDGSPVGKISFQIEVVRDASGARKLPVGKEARHYHSCFCSYSSLDRVEMLKRAQGLRATGLQTFIDVMTLRPGEVWNPKILAAIDESDLFVVIWSQNARDSKWVKKESRYALNLCEQRGSPDFVPIPVEGPPIASVPRGLKARHFNDELLSLIRAAEVEAEERNKKKTEQGKLEA